MTDNQKTVYELEHVAIGQRDIGTGDIVSVTAPIARAWGTQAAEPWATFDPTNYIAVLVHICDTFGLTHPQMMELRERVEKTFHAQPQVFSVRAPAPVTLNGVAITYGLLIGFGGFRDALKASIDRVVKLARGYDPYKDVDPALQKAMHKRAQANRRARR